MRSILNSYFPAGYHIPLYWPAGESPAIVPDGLAVGVAFGDLVVALPGMVQEILPAGLALALGLGVLVVTRRAAVNVPLYVIDYDQRVYEVPAESRVYVAEV